MTSDFDRTAPELRKDGTRRLPGFGRLFIRCLRAWQRRRRRQAMDRLLDRLGDRMLEDIGLHRSEIHPLADYASWPGGDIRGSAGSEIQRYRIRTVHRGR